MDLAANDAVKLSNTLTLEQMFGWKGLCIEPNPGYMKGYLHRKCQLVQAVVDGEFTDFFRAFARDYDPVTCPTKFASVDNEKYGSTDFPLPASLRHLFARHQYVYV